MYIAGASIWWNQLENNLNSGQDNLNKDRTITFSEKCTLPVHPFGGTSWRLTDGTYIRNSIANAGTYQQEPADHFETGVHRRCIHLVVPLGVY